MRRWLNNPRWIATPAAIICAWALTGLFALQSFGQQQLGGPIEPPSLPSLRHVVKQFDFEEAGESPNALPAEFYRLIAPSQGFPPFGSMRLTADVPAAGGRGTFEFNLEGGSMSARVRTSVIPVLPLADYIVTAKVRTKGLTHARARLVAWLHDAKGAPIPASRSYSRLANTNGRWEALAVEVQGDFSQAADLVLELQLVQPEQYATADQLLADAPLLQDVEGQAWFDDVTVAHLPRVSLTMASPGNLVYQPHQPELDMMVSELTGEPLTARLRVFDLNGQTMFDQSFLAPRGRQVTTIAVPLQTCGWYRAVLDVTGSTDLARQRWLDFMILPEERTARRSSRRHRSSDGFGMVLRRLPPGTDSIIPTMLEALHVGAATVPVWPDDEEEAGDADEAQAVRRALIERLLRDNLQLTFSLEAVPTDLCAIQNLQPAQVLELLSRDSRVWRPYVDDLLVNFGLSVSRWHLGATGSAEAFWEPNVAQAVVSASRSLADYVPEPILYTSWSIEQEPVVPTEIAAAGAAASNLPSAFAVSVPVNVQPSSLPEYARPWIDTEGETLTILETLPDDRYTPRQRIIDLTLRGLYGWRAGLPMLAITEPWRYAEGEESGIMPDPIFAPWRTLAMCLADHDFVGELSLSEGQHCWILGHRETGKGMIIAWCDAMGPTASTLRAQLAGGKVDVVDLFGNRSALELEDGQHTLHLTEMPVIVENVNLELVQFPGGLRIEPSFVPAVAKVHEHTIILRNPWSVAVTGTIRFMPDDQWQLSPSAQDFNIGPGGEVRLPVYIIPQRNIIAGRRRVNAEVTFTADRSYTLHIYAELEVGLRDIELAASWSAWRNPQTGAEDVVISQAVTNRGDRVVNLEVYMLAPNVSQSRRTIAGLRPGETAVRSFRIPNGMAFLAGQQVRVGVAEIDGVTRLNRVLTIGSGESESVLADAPTE